VITSSDNSKVEVTENFTLEEIKELNHPHKQMYVAMVGETRKSNNNHEL
jgi:hypothetical protein